MSNNIAMDRKVISIITGGILLLLIIGIVLILTWYELPETNRNIITMLIGALGAAIPTAVTKFLGDDPEQIKQLKDKNKELMERESVLENKISNLTVEIETLRRELDDLKTRFINKINTIT